MSKVNQTIFQIPDFAPIFGLDLRLLDLGPEISKCLKKLIKSAINIFYKI